MRLLVVEDDPAIAGPLRTGLERENFEVELARTGADALAAREPDLVLLDLGLPYMDGGDVCRKLRGRSSVPIIVVTARGDELDRVILLELGADDYVVKPFGFRELVARIRAVLRRANAPAPEPQQEQGVTIGPLVVDTRTHVVSWQGDEVALTPKEYDLLLYLARDPGAVVTRDKIMEDVWDASWWGSTKTLDVHIASLRKKLSPDLVETVRGVGFRLADLSES
jgi:two-component system, OmpR family, response regulator RegX3